MQTCYFFVQMFGQHIHFVFVVFAVFPQLDLCQSLVCKRVTHHKRRVSCSTAQVYQTSFCQNNDVISFYVVNIRSEEHTSELQSRENLVCRLLLENKKN